MDDSMKLRYAKLAGPGNWYTFKDGLRAQLDWDGLGHIISTIEPIIYIADPAAPPLTPETVSLPPTPPTMEEERKARARILFSCEDMVKQHIQHTTTGNQAYRILKGLYERQNSNNQLLLENRFDALLQAPDEDAQSWSARVRTAAYASAGAGNPISTAKQLSKLLNGLNESLSSVGTTLTQTVSITPGLVLTFDTVVNALLTQEANTELRAQRVNHASAWPHELRTYLSATEFPLSQTHL